MTIEIPVWLLWVIAVPFTIFSIASILFTVWFFYRLAKD